MTLKNGFGKCSLFVLSANGWKDQNMPKKTLIWRRHCSIGQSCCSMTSKRRMDWFLESSRAWSRHARLCPLDEPIISLYFRSFLGSVLFAFSFQGQTKIALSISIKKFRRGDPGAGRGGLFKNKNNPWIWLNFFEVVVNGGWGNWSDWSACSASCGPGNSIRTRRCDSPPPGAGGNPCVGLRLENKPCNLRPCPTGKYTERAEHMYKCE